MLAEKSSTVKFETNGGLITETETGTVTKVLENPQRYVVKTASSVQIVDARDVVEVIEPKRDEIVLETTGYARGRQILNEELERVRVNGNGYREATSPDFGAALDWLMREGYELVNKAKPRQRMGTIKVRYFYAREAA